MGTSKGYLPPTGHLWRDAKRSVTSMAKDNFSRDGIGKTMSKFSDAMMNSNRNSSGQLHSFAISGSSAVGFFTNAKQYGFNEALNKIGLQDLIGKSNEEVFIGLLDYFSGDGSTIEKNIVRDSMSELLKEKMVDIIGDEGSFDDIISNMDMNKFITDFIIKFIQKSFLTNFSEKLEGLCKNLDDYIKGEKDVKDFIRIEIERNYTPEELNNIDWKGKQGLDFINKKCKEAFELFEMWKGDSDENMD